MTEKIAKPRKTQSFTDHSAEVGLASFRWTEDQGMQGLGSLGDGSLIIAAGVSADGSVVAGWAQTPSGQGPFRWTEQIGKGR